MEAGRWEREEEKSIRCSLRNFLSRGLVLFAYSYIIMFWPELLRKMPLGLVERYETVQRRYLVFYSTS